MNMQGALGKDYLLFKTNIHLAPYLRVLFHAKFMKTQASSGNDSLPLFFPSLPLLPTEIPQLLASCLLLNGDEYGKMWDSSQTDYAKRIHGYLRDN